MSVLVVYHLRQVFLTRLDELVLCQFNSSHEIWLIRTQEKYIVNQTLCYFNIYSKTWFIWIRTQEKYISNMYFTNWISILTFESFVLKRSSLCQLNKYIALFANWISANSIFIQRHLVHYIRTQEKYIALFANYTLPIQYLFNDLVHSNSYSREV
jgi:hypothetical protein